MGSIRGSDGSLRQSIRGFKQRVLMNFHETKYPSYSVGLFLNELPISVWEALYNGVGEILSAKCTLLHEYIHYLQDTATYYGSLYRIGRYNQSAIGVMAADVLGATIVEVEGKQDVVSEEKGKLMFGKFTVGSLLIKENMAVTAQNYAFGDTGVSNIPTSCNYNAVSRYIWRELKPLTSCYLLTFALYEMSLTTENPSVALQELIGCLRGSDILRKVRYYTEEELVGMIYEEGETYLESKGLLDYNQIREVSALNRETFDVLEGSMETLPCEGGVVKGHTNKNRLFSYFKQKVMSNITLRVNRPTITIRSLMDIKHTQDKDMKVFYKRFGQPYMLCVDDKGVVRTNIAEIMR